MERADPTSESGTVLIVDDEPVLRMMASDIVNDAGFHAIEANSADEALTMLEQCSDICLVLTDVQMPGSMNGFDLAARIRKHWPALAIIITSGRAQPKSGSLPTNTSFFAKPYRPDMLLAVLRQAIPRAALCGT